MRSPQDYKKAKGLFGADMKKYEEVYSIYAASGYTKELCEAYASAFVDDVKKPSNFDIVETARLYDRIHDSKMVEFYLSMLSDKKISGDDKFYYCIETLKNMSKQGHWRDAEDFRTENINFMQKHSEKVSMKRTADMYIALALADCAAKKYDQAMRLITGFGYKPGKNDTKLLEMLITTVYIYAKKGDNEALEGAIANAKGGLKLITEPEFPWSVDYYEKCIDEAANGVL